jgi:hypothetical protein
MLLIRKNGRKRSRWARDRSGCSEGEFGYFRAGVEADTVDPADASVDVQVFASGGVGSGDEFLVFDRDGWGTKKGDIDLSTVGVTGEGPRGGLVKDFEEGVGIVNQGQAGFVFGDVSEGGPGLEIGAPVFVKADEVKGGRALGDEASLVAKDL